MEILGRGGMGVVYRASTNQLGREVAIKTLTKGVADDPEMLARFYEEGKKTARLKHPHIVIVYDLGEENGIPYIVMERGRRRLSRKADPRQQPTGNAGPAEDRGRNVRRSRATHTPTT